MPEMNCPTCGTPMDPNGRFCPSCGQQYTPQAAPVPQYQAPTPPPPQYQPPRPQYQAPQPVYQAAPQNSNLAPVLTLGNYIVMMIVAGIPLVGFIMLLVWAFGSTENPNKKNFARAVLIISIIASVLMIIISLITGGAMLSVLSQYDNLL